MPVLLTVIKEAATPRPYQARRLMAFKNARSLSEIEEMAAGNSLLYVDELVEEYRQKKLFIPTLTLDDLEVDPGRCGLRGSPTKVRAVQSVVLSSGAHENIEPTKEGIGGLIAKLDADRVFG